MRHLIKPPGIIHKLIIKMVTTSGSLIQLITAQADSYTQPTIPTASYSSFWLVQTHTDSLQHGDFSVLHKFSEASCRQLLVFCAMFSLSVLIILPLLLFNFVPIDLLYFPTITIYDRSFCAFVKYL